MRPNRFLILVVMLMTAGCATIGEMSRMKSLENVSQLYERVMLDSDFEAAQEFIDPGANPKQPDMAAYKDIKIVAYNVKKSKIAADASEISQSVEVQYYRTDNLVVKTMRVEQLWGYNETAKSWRLKNGLPQFK